MRSIVNKLTLSLALLAAAVTAVSCADAHNDKAFAQSQQERSAAEEKVQLDKNLQPVYGKPGPDMIRVYVFGTESTMQGIYYFKTGTTLGVALQVTKYSDFARHLRVYNLAKGGAIKSSYYKFHHLSDAEKARVLHDNDCLVFPCSLI